MRLTLKRVLGGTGFSSLVSSGCVATGGLAGDRERARRATFLRANRDLTLDVNVLADEPGLVLKYMQAIVVNDIEKWMRVGKKGVESKKGEVYI